MGHMKNLHIDLYNANNGKIPECLTMDDAILMIEWNTYNWEEYLERKLMFKNKNEERKRK